jgi:hypothetical protein
MKELKDVYKKNKKDINDVEDLLLKFVYAQPEDFAANDTEGMEISGANVGDVQTMLSKEFGIKESVVNEAIKVEGKRDAKKVVTVYNKIFNKVLVDLGAMSTESILGCIKYLTFEAMGDANFHREADAVSKMIKGNIKPLEIKMNGLGGHFIKIGPATIKSILDKYYSDIANAAGWSGIGIVEGTALYLEQIKQEAMGQAAINKFNQTFEGEDVRVDLDSKINESNEVESITVSDEATKLEERNAFLGARAKAIEEDLEEFEFNGKTYPVTINESTVFDSVKCSNKKGHSWKQVDKDGTVECEHCGLRNSLSEEVVTEEVEEVEEGNAFGDAVRKAKEAGDKEFEFDGKTYKVEESEEVKVEEEEEEAVKEESEEEVNENPAAAIAVASMLKEVYEACKNEAKVWEDDAHDSHTIESYMAENAALVASLAAKSLKEMKDEYSTEAFEAACNSMIESYTTKINEMKESELADDAADVE